MISFGTGISKEDIVLFVSGNDLVIDNHWNQVTIKNQLKGASVIEKIQLNDNSYITGDVINNLIQQMTLYTTENHLDITNINAITGSSYLTNLIANSWQSA